MAGKIIDMDAPAEKILTASQLDKPLQKETIPLGYIPIELSTNGKLGVPKTVYCRNFSTADLVELSMFNDSILPERVIAVLSSLIYGESNVGDWPDKCIIELLVRIYVNYFTPILTSRDFPWDETDTAWLRANKLETQAKDLEEGKWTPKVDVDLRNVKIRSLDDQIKNYVTIKKRNKDGSPLLEAKFISYPKFGDTLVLRKAVAEKFVEEDRAFARLTQQIEVKDRYISEGRDIAALTPVFDADYIKWQIYQAKKAVYMTRATRALSLISYNGVDLSKKSLDERIRYVESPLFDISMSKIIDEQYNKMDFGILPDIDLMNPITKTKCTRRFQFQFMDIIQAVLTSSPDGYDIYYDE